MWPSAAVSCSYRTISSIKIKRPFRLILFIVIIFTFSILYFRKVFIPRAREYKTNNAKGLGSWSAYWNNKKVKSPMTDMLEDLKAAGYNVTLISNSLRPPSLSTRRKENNVRVDTLTTPPPLPFVVPNVVHFVWLGSDLKFTLIQYLSFISASRHIDPDYIFVHGEVGPSGYWWNKTMNEISNIYLVYTAAPKNAYSGKRFAYPAHGSDLLRTEIIYRFGGIYLDGDVIVIKSFDPLRRFNTTMGRERGDGICNGVIISRKGAPFIRLLLDQYQSYAVSKTENWMYRSVEVPHNLEKIFPSWIHVEETSLNRPNCMERHLIFEQVWDWSKNYAIHTWVRMQITDGRRVPKSLKDINCGNTTIAEIGRLAIYGSSANKCT